jgi:hypothetical protein
MSVSTGFGNYPPGVTDNDPHFDNWDEDQLDDEEPDEYEEALGNCSGFFDGGHFVCGAAGSEDCDARYVAGTGDDPLHEYFVKRDYKKREAWHFQFRRTVGGLFLEKAKRRGGAWIAARTLPAYVRQYASVAEPQTGKLARVNWDEGDVKLTKTLRYAATIEHKVPRPAGLVQADLKRLAGKHLRRPALFSR